MMTVVEVEDRKKAPEMWRWRPETAQSLLSVAPPNHGLSFFDALLPEMLLSHTTT